MTSIKPPQPSNRNLALFGVGIAIAVSLPSTIAQVSEPVVRVLLQLGAVVVVFAVGYLSDRKR